jgi:membrane protein DedA with SNARE-associated domain
MLHFFSSISQYFSFEHVRHWLEWGGYLMLFTLLFSCGLGLPLPEDIPLMTAGFLISQHHMHLAFAAPIAWLGIMGGDCVLYRFGWRYGTQITQVPFIGRHVTAQRIELVANLFARYGVWVVGFGRVIAGIRGAMVVAAGATRYRFLKFIIADGLAAIVSGGMFMALGYWFGSNLDEMKRRGHELTGIIIGIAIVAAILLGIYIWWRKKKHIGIGDVIAQKAQTMVWKKPETTPGEKSEIDI